MGIQRKIQRRLAQQQIAMADTHCGFNQCKIFLAHPNPLICSKAVKEFGPWFAAVNERARRVNIGDLYNAHFRMLEKVRKGEDLVNNGQGRQEKADAG